MNYQDLRENRLYFTGGIIYMIGYAVYTAVRYFTLGLKDISGWYIRAIFALVLFAVFVYSCYCLFEAVRSFDNGSAEKHNLPFWLSVWGDLGYACMVYTVIDLFI